MKPGDIEDKPQWLACSRGNGRKNEAGRLFPAGEVQNSGAAINRRGEEECGGSG